MKRIVIVGAVIFGASDDSRVVVGATFESGVGFDCRVTAAGQKEVLDRDPGFTTIAFAPL